MLVLPSQVSGLDFVDAIVGETGAKTAGFSGWAVEDSYKYANGFDETFVLSDHCDFPELRNLVRAVDPEQVYTQHGSATALAQALTREDGYQATALSRNQTSLGEF